MNLRNLGALFLLFTIVNSTPFYEINDLILIGQQRLDFTPYDYEGPFEGDFIKKGDIY